MKSNMSSLTKKLLFLWVFFIVCKLSTSGDVEDCKSNVHEIFLSENEPFLHLNTAMLALSEPLLTSSFLATDVKKLFDHFKTYDEAVKSIVLQTGERIFSSKHKDLLGYLKYVISWKYHYGPENNDNSDSALAKKQADLVGYFRSFAKIIDAIADRINGIMSSPQGFCKDHKKPEECSEALCIMLKRDDAMKIKGSEALKICYLNYIYIDFTVENIFPEFGSSSSSSSKSSAHSSKQSQVGIMASYFSYLLEIATQISKFNLIEDHHPDFLYHAIQDPPIFLSVSEYCSTPVQNRG